MILLRRFLLELRIKVIFCGSEIFIYHLNFLLYFFPDNPRLRSLQFSFGYIQLSNYQTGQTLLPFSFWLHSHLNIFYFTSLILIKTDQYTSASRNVTDPCILINIFLFKKLYFIIILFSLQKSINLPKLSFFPNLSPTLP